jgi:hypothetical protein
MPDLLEWLDGLAAAQDAAAATATKLVDEIAEGTDWWDDGDVAGKALDAAEEVREAELLVAGSVDEFFEGIDDIVGTDAPSGFESSVDDFLRGIEPESNPIPVYSRPAEQYRYARSRGGSDAEGRSAAKLRRSRLVDQDVALAARGAYQDNLRARNITQYRRMLHPELSRTGPCGLCYVAASRVYSTAELLPLHRGCRCTVLPVLDGNDPGLEINDKDLGEVYEAAGSTRRAELQRTRVVVREHGEVGPVLVRAGESFLAAREAALPAAERVEGELEVLVERLALLESALRGGSADSAAPLAWVRARVEFLRGLQ